MSVSYNKKKHTFTYTGSLEQAIVYALKQIESMDKNFDYINKRYNEEKRRFDTFHSKYFNLKRFIQLAEEKLNKQKVGNDNEM